MSALAVSRVSFLVETTSVLSHAQMDSMATSLEIVSLAGWYLRIIVIYYFLL